MIGPSFSVKSSASLTVLTLLLACGEGSREGSANEDVRVDIADVPTADVEIDSIDDSADIAWDLNDVADIDVETDTGVDVCAAGPASDGECQAFCGWRDVGAEEQKELDRRAGCISPDRLSSDDGLSLILDDSDFEALGAGSTADFLGAFEDPWVVKFGVDDITADEPWLYFIQTVPHSAHWMFFRAIGCDADYGPARVPGELYRFSDERYASDGGWAYAFDASSSGDMFTFETIARVYELLIAGMPSLEGRLVYVPLDDEQRAQVRSESDLYDAAEFVTLEVVEPDPDARFRSMNPGVALGRLRVVEPGEFPTPQDIAVYSSLPNQLLRTAGIITTVPQTPLSHVNLRATQDGVPNAFVRGPVGALPFADLIDTWVFYEVTSDGYTVRAASDVEVSAYYASFQPVDVQVPSLDLSVSEVAALDDIGFGDRHAYGMKAAGVAELRTLGFIEGTVPDGFALPFYFYDEFMTFSGLDDRVAELLAEPEFTQSVGYRESALDQLRDEIRGSVVPPWMMDALSEVQSSFDPAQPIRCRSSSNAEDLEGFSGAGLYESYTHHPEEGHLSKSVLQVFASLWTLRAVDAREFHGIAQTGVAMGVLMHPNYSDERVNGVAVTRDVLTAAPNTYYVNSQVGEDLVTNPEEGEIPEELSIAVDPAGGFRVVHPSSLAEEGELLLSEPQIDQLRSSLGAIHERFADLYEIDSAEPFAMEIEFKITADGQLAIKQARPWVFEMSGARRWTEEACACRCL